MKLNINSRLKLNNGVEIPYLGLGTYRITSRRKIDRAINEAFETGYRLIDSAAAYGNEEEIGKVIKSISIPREEIFITTKLDNYDHGYNQTLKAFDESLKKLDSDYIDLYLIHWPVRGRNDSWKAMENILESGKCKAIGVSNFMIQHLEDLKNNSSIMPAVNQIEMNPFMFEKDVISFCNNLNIAIEAYTPITKGKRFKHKEIKRLSSKYQKTAAQIMLRWSLQHNAIVIPKSSHPDRIKENSDIFDFNLDDADMEILNSLNENLRSSPDPYNYV